MDLSTVMKKLDNGEYHNINDFINDVKLIWSNSMTYNQEQSDYYRLAKKMQSLFDQKIKKLPGSDDAKYFFN